MTTNPGEGVQAEPTVDQILTQIRSTSDTERASNPKWYLDKAEDLAMALILEEETLVDLRGEVAQKKLDYMRNQTKRNVSEADLYMEAQPEYIKFRKQEAKVDQAKEIIRVYKKIAEGFMRGY